MTAIKKIPFHNTEILSVERDGRPWVLFRPLCDALGLDARRQRERIQEAAWARDSWQVLEITDVPGQPPQQYLVLTPRALYMWLATISDYLWEKGEKRITDIAFGKTVAALYRNKHGKEPSKEQRTLKSGRVTSINAYMEADRDLFDLAHAALLGAL